MGKKKDYTTKVIIGIAVVIIIFLIIAILEGSITGNIAREINPPYPRVVDVDCKPYGSGVLNLDQRTEVEVTVQNNGGAGNVDVIAKLDQTDSRFDRTESRIIFFDKNEVKSVIFDFDSSSFRNGKCSGNAYAY